VLRSKQLPPSPSPSAPVRAAPAPPRAVAVLDIGSSAIRMEIAQLGPNGTQTLESLQRAVPLGKDCFSKGRIERRTINLAIEVLRGYQQIMEPYAIHIFRAVATSAVREATNQELFLDRVYMATGIAVEVITAAEEDRLLYAAVRDAFRADQLDTDEDALIVEQGAGSLEIAMTRGGEIVSASAYPLGTIRLANAVSAEHRSSPESLELMKRYLGSSIDEIEHTFPLDETRHFIVVGGDARFAAERLRKGESGKRVRALSREEFLRFARETARLRPEQIARKYRLAVEECESVSPALLTYSELLKRCPAQEVLVPDVSMRDGLILDLIAETTGQRLTEIDAQVYASAENIGRRYQFDEPHAHHVADMACVLFDALAAEHGLGRRERRLLRVAAVLHDVGLFISSNSHHKHSEYIIGASDIFGVRAEERAIVACVARYHRRGPPVTSHVNYAALTRADRATVSKLSALLRVADTLDRSHSQRVELASCELKADELVLGVRSTEDLALERMAMRSKGDLFEEVFGRRVVLQFEDSRR
jgi:exopolyphosphatase/guanosine-5'-triphosphate,3'-diphosphate pyrophosphatase